MPPRAITKESEHYRELRSFYDRVAVFNSFAQLTEPSIYVPLPEGWVLGLADIVQSTVAIDSGHYKAVNTAAASVIAAISNALAGTDFPFVFGGDGASFALPTEYEELARKALAAVAAWVRDDLGMNMRVALVPVGVIRASGFDACGAIPLAAASHIGRRPTRNRQRKGAPVRSGEGRLGSGALTSNSC